jgi:hypothetical protein
MPDTPHQIPLTVSVSGNTVTILGEGGANLPKGSGSHRFNFGLTDQTRLDVKFESLDAEDNQPTCPPASGQNSSQIQGVSMQNNGQNKSAGFTDLNNNQNGSMSLCYQWNFSCNDPSKTVKPFDPIIINGGA